MTDIKPLIALARIATAGTAIYSFGFFENKEDNKQGIDKVEKQFLFGTIENKNAVYFFNASYFSVPIKLFNFSSSFIIFGKRLFDWFS